MPAASAPATVTVTETMPPGTPVEPVATGPAASGGVPQAASNVALAAAAGSAAAPGANAAAASPAPVAAAASAALQLRARAPSWIEVQDANSQVLLSRHLKPGETVSLAGALPMRVKIGNAVATELVFRGQPLDLAASTRDNVARLELK
jgi:cytoskeleton protein RodZ